MKTAFILATFFVAAQSFGMSTSCGGSSVKKMGIGSVCRPHVENDDDDSTNALSFA